MILMTHGKLKYNNLPLPPDTHPPTNLYNNMLHNCLQTVGLGTALVHHLMSTAFAAGRYATEVSVVLVAPPGSRGASSTTSLKSLLPPTHWPPWGHMAIMSYSVSTEIG